MARRGTALREHVLLTAKDVVLVKGFERTSAVRALTDPEASGGDYFTPSGPFRGEPVLDQKRARSTSLSATETTRVWEQLSQLAGVQVPV